MKKKKEKIKKYTLKMEPLGNYLTFRTRPWNRPLLLKSTEKGTGEGSLPQKKEPRKEPVKVLDCDSV